MIENVDQQRPQLQARRSGVLRGYLTGQERHKIIRQLVPRRNSIAGFASWCTLDNADFIFGQHGILCRPIGGGVTS
jgi:hypothetical protein